MASKQDQVQTEEPDHASARDIESGLTADEKTRISDDEQDLSVGNADVVDWDGPDDPINPMNWTEKKKWTQIAVISAMTIVTPLGSAMFAPGIPGIMAEFKETSATIATFVVSIYVLGFAFGPLIVAPLSEIYGRVHLYNYGNILFTIFTVGTALSQNMDMMLAFRFLMGLAGSVPITIGSGTIADIMPVERRGRAMSAWALGPLLGPCIGPVAGGYLIRAAGWRWVFWLVAILGGLFIPVSFLLLRETYAPVILEQKVNRLRKETDNQNLRSKNQREETITQKFKTAIIRPLKLLLTVPLVMSSALYVAIVYGILYLLISTFTFVFRDQYGFDEGSSGLTFLPAGIGMMIGVGSFGPLADAMVKSAQAKGGEIVPEIRIRPILAIPCATVLPAGLFIYGWTTEKQVHFIVPMLGVVIFSAGLMGVMMCMQNYLLDTYPRYAASVTAALTVLRSLAGALLPLGGLEMYYALGLGWGNSLLAFISLAMVPIPLVFFIFGKKIRARSQIE